MKTYKTVKEIKADVRDGVLKVNDDVTFELSFKLDISLNVSGSIIAKSINCWGIKCLDITCGDINCWGITCWGITCWDITCGDINCGDINCWGITCGNITCRNITYYAFCCVYGKMKCRTWKYRRENGRAPIVLDGKIETATAGEGNE